MSAFSTVLSGLWNNFKTAEERALLVPLAALSTNYAANPTGLNFIAQASLALTQAEAAQPGILQNEIGEIATLLSQVASSLPAEIAASAAAKKA